MTRSNYPPVAPVVASADRLMRGDRPTRKGVHQQRKSDELPPPKNVACRQLQTTVERRQRKTGARLEQQMRGESRLLGANLEREESLERGESRWLLEVLRNGCPR